MTIKKVYVELVEFLEANQGKKVATVMPQLLAMVETKNQGSTVMRDEQNNVIAIFCYYHKQWELVSEVEYGNKASSATGLNTMCKAGVSKWTKQNRKAKEKERELLQLLADEHIKPHDIKDMQADIEADRLKLDETDMPHGFASEAEVLDYLAS